MNILTEEFLVIFASYGVIDKCWPFVLLFGPALVLKDGLFIPFSLQNFRVHVFLDFLFKLFSNLLFFLSFELLFFFLLNFQKLLHH